MYPTIYHSIMMMDSKATVSSSLMVIFHSFTYLAILLVIFIPIYTGVIFYVVVRR